MARPIFAFIFVLFLFCPAFAQTADQTISLKKGFNFISFTVNPSLTPVELKQNNSAIIEDIYLYSATAGSFFNLSEGTLTTIASGKGYILKSLTDATITVNGTPVSVIGNINLKNGFNLIGISKALTNNKFSDAIKNNSVIGGIYKWSPASGSFVQVVRNLSGTADLIDGVDPSFSEGQAYFINIKADTQFNYDGEAIQFGDNIVIRAAKPMFNPNDCSFTSAQQVSITSLTKGATIKYTTDGSVPSSTNGEVYSGPVNVTSTTTIKSIAFKTGIVDSEIASATYTKSIMPTVPTIALDLGRGVKLEMVKISAAGKSFQMGSPDTEQDRESDEGPVHTVSFTKDYYIGKYEVTQAQWLEICGKWPGLSPSTTYGAGENYPAYNVSWHDMYIVGGFFEKINALKPGGYYGFRLPTEAEWEYAARGGTQTRFYWGNDSSYSEIGNYVWFYGNSYTTTHPVGQKLPNGFGLYDMPGNVLELCDDWYGSYRSSSAIDPTGSKMGPYCVSRGGCWNHNANYCRSADRERIYSIYDSGNLLGFRVVLADKLMPEQIVETPSIAPGGITFTAAQNVTITCATIGAIIKYTTDGTTPSSMNGTTYSGTFTISSTTTIKAIACKNGMSDSDVASITYVNTSPAGEVLTLSLGGGVTLEMVKIPAAGKSFRMGSPDTEQDHVSSEGPVHNVSFTNDYYIGKYELTQGQWKAIMNGANPSYFKSNDYNPVEQISWENLTNNFIPAINARKLGYGTFRLPTEAEWEYAARCGTETRFYWGDDLSYIQAENYLWFGDNSRSTTHPVGQKLPNAFGLYDMSGNVMEWCIDWYGDYNGLDATDPVGPASGTFRVLRGGCWEYKAKGCRSAVRLRNEPINYYYSVGARLVLSTGQPTSENSNINPKTSTFDKSSLTQSDVFVVMALNGNTLTAIKNGAVSLIEGTDFNVSVNTVSIKKSYLANQPNGTITITFKFSAGTDQGLTITIFGTPPVAAPIFNPPGGTYTSRQSVNITCATDGAEIYYTLDGSTPTASCTKYIGPISVLLTKTIKAIAVKNGRIDSSAITATFTINVPLPPPGPNLKQEFKESDHLNH